MKPAWALLAFLAVASPAIPYFKYQRPVAAPATNGQHFAAIDDAIWPHALPDLGDLRLYAAGNEIPFALKTMRGSRETEQRSIRVLQPGTLSGKTEFLLDMADVPEYDRVALALAPRNYVAHARVEGQDDLHGRRWADLGTTTIFDLSDEKLGHNSTLQIPVSTYRFLRVTIDATVKPTDIQSATAGIERAQEAVWQDIAGEPAEKQDGKNTIFTFSVPRNTPVERILFSVDTAQGNFQREIEMQRGDGSSTGLGEISRIHMQRNGGRIDVEQSALALNTRGEGQLRAVIHNGDDAPLKITRARLQRYERRIYFDAAAGASLALCYGDDKLNAPVYDYAKLFQSDASAGKLEVGPETPNSAYTGRPDERPWSERYPAVLWVAILAAVAVLGAIAVRSIKSAGKT